MKIIVNLNKQLIAWPDSEIVFKIENFINNFSSGPKYCKSWSNGFVHYSSIDDTLSFNTSNWSVVNYIRYKYISVPKQERPEIVFNFYHMKNVEYTDDFRFNIDYRDFPFINQFDTWMLQIAFWPANVLN